MIQDGEQWTIQSSSLRFYTVTDEKSPSSAAIDRITYYYCFKIYVL